MATAFHRLARDSPEYAWWRLPAAGLIAVPVYFVASGVFLVAVLVGLEVAGIDGVAVTGNWIDDAALLDLAHPGTFALSMVSIALMLPVVLVSVFAVGPRRIGYLTSVEGRMRWRWLAITSLLSFVLFGVALGGSLVLAELDDPASVSAPTLDDRAVVALVLVLLLTPFQAAAEEYVFRGYLLQLVGSWTRFAVIPVLVSVPFFVAGHTYSFWGLVDVGIFGLTAAYLTVRTGGLEAAIAAHVANNVVLLVFEALGMFVSTDEGAAPVDVLPTVVTSTVLVLAVEVLVRRLGIVRTRPTPDPPAPVQGPPAPQVSSWQPPYPYPPVWWQPPPPQWWVPSPQPWPAPAPVEQPQYPGPPYPGEVPPGWRP